MGEFVSSKELRERVAAKLRALADAKEQPLGTHDVEIVIVTPRRFFNNFLGEKRQVVIRPAVIDWTWIGVTLDGEIIKLDAMGAWSPVPFDRLSDIDLDFLDTHVLPRL